LSILIIEDGILVEVLDDWKEFLHLDIIAENIEECISIHCFALLKGLEHDFRRRNSLISDWSIHFVQVMGSNRSQGTSTADILMQLILQIDEGVVCRDIEGNVAQNAAHDTRSNCGSLWLDDNFL